MEGAALDARGGPDLLACFGEPTAPIREDQLWGGNPAHEGLPSSGVLTPGRVPSQHVIGPLGDEDHGIAAQVDTVNEDDLMDLINDRAERAQLPQRLTTPAKRAAPTRHIHLTATT